MYVVFFCCCCRRPSSTSSHAINHHRCLLLALTGPSTVVLAIHCYCHISTITTTTTIVPTTPCPPAQSRLSPTAAAGSLLACDVMQCSSCLQLTHGLSLLLLLLHVMFMCQWYCDPPAGSAAAVAGLFGRLVASLYLWYRE
jgi:hypothetical protein